MSGIEVTALSVSVADVTLVRDVSFSVPPGRWVTVVGPNGAGKTTLVEAVAGVRRATFGVVRVNGHDVHEVSERERARHLAFVPQHPVVPVGMSVRDYVALGRTAHHGVLVGESPSDRRVVAEVIRRVGLEHLTARDVSTLSGGERQRAVIARALSQQAPVLVLDEPTSGLDIRHQIETLELLAGEVRDNGLCVLATLHDLTLAGQFAHDLVLIDESRVTRSGPSRDIVRSSELSLAYGIALTVIDVEGFDVVVPRRTDTSTTLTVSNED